MSNLLPKVALIIGGTSGIGKATTEALLRKGATVHIVGRNPQKTADAPNLIKHQVDITDREEVANLINKISQLSNLDYLVNASGIFEPKPFLEHTAADYDSYLDLTFFNASQLTQIIFGSATNVHHLIFKTSMVLTSHIEVWCTSTALPNY